MPRCCNRHGAHVPAAISAVSRRASSVLLPTAVLSSETRLAISDRSYRSSRLFVRLFVSKQASLLAGLTKMGLNVRASNYEHHQTPRPTGVASHSSRHAVLHHTINTDRTRYRYRSRYRARRERHTCVWSSTCRSIPLTSCCIVMICCGHSCSSIVFDRLSTIPSTYLRARAHTHINVERTNELDISLISFDDRTSRRSVLQ